MERPPHNVEPPDEPGKLLQFPDVWVPPDGVQPLNGSGAAVDSANAENGGELDGRDASRSERPAFEAGEFWERGDTQEFVGVAARPPGSTTSDGDDGLAGIDAAGTQVAGLAATSNGHPRGRTGTLDNATTSGSTAHRAGPKAAGVAILVLGVLVGGGIALATALQPRPQTRRDAGLIAARHVTTHRTSPATSHEAIPPAIQVHRPPSSVTHRQRSSSRRPRARTTGATSAQPVRYVKQAPAASSSSGSTSQFTSAGSSTPTGGGQASPSAQAAQSQSSQTAQPAHYGVAGPLVCISNCGG